jgi:hypothetical protein
MNLMLAGFDAICTEDETIATQLGCYEKQKLVS